MRSQTVLSFSIYLRRTFSNSIAFSVINKYRKGAAVQIWIVLEPVYDVACPRLLANGIFQTYVFARFSDSVISEIYVPWESSSFPKYSKFNIDFENSAKNLEKLSCVWHNCIWIGCVKMSLLIREYLSDVVNVLTNSLKILAVNVLTNSLKI